MPESRIRKKAAYTAPTKAAKVQVNPPWFLPVMCGLMIFGLAWIVVFYVSAGKYPVESISGWQVGNWNLVLGFGFIMAGFAMATRWR